MFNKKNKIEDKAIKFIELEKSLRSLEKDIEEAGMDFQIKKSEYTESLKLADNSFVESKISEKYKIYNSLHLKNLGKLRKEKNKLIKSMSSVYVENEEFNQLIKSEKQKEAYSTILKSYRNGDVDLSVSDGLLKALRHDKVKYADNIVFNENNQILLLRRSEQDKTFAGMYVIPGGHVDFGEDCETAAKRELNEEAGVVVEDVEHVGEYEDKKVHINYFQSYVNNVEPVLQEEEITGYEWVDVKDLDKYEMPLNMAENILKIVNPIKQQVLKLKKALDQDLISKDQFKILTSKIIEKALTTENTEDLRKESLDKKVKDLNSESGVDWNEKLKKLKKRRDPEGIEKGEEIEGGKSDNKSIQDIADLHKVSKTTIQDQVKIGLKIEMEHTDDAKKALEIVKDHLFEFKDYYTRLKKMEEKAKEKSLESDIFKAWESAQLGEVRTHKDGKKFKKVSNTGDKNKDWQLVTNSKNKQEGSDNVSKEGNKGTGGDKKVDTANLSEAAKNASETNLTAAIKESDDPKLREAANKELERREAEEKPQNKEKGADTKTESKETPKKEDSKDKEGKIKVYRGKGENTGEGENKGLNWVATDKSVAENYGEISEELIDKPKNIFRLPFRKNPDTNREVDIKGSDISDLLFMELGDKFESGKISEEDIDLISSKIDEYEKLAGNKLEPFPDKINKPESVEKFAEILRDLGYDAVEILENNKKSKPTKTFGLIKKELLKIKTETKDKSKEKDEK